MIVIIAASVCAQGFPSIQIPADTSPEVIVQLKLQSSHDIGQVIALGFNNNNLDFVKGFGRTQPSSQNGTGLSSKIRVRISGWTSWWSRSRDWGSVQTKL